MNEQVNTLAETGTPTNRAESLRALELFKVASRYIPGGVNSSRRNARSQLCVSKGFGAYIEDLEGRRFIDYHAAYGAILLGHSYPDVVERVSEAIRDSVLFGVGVTEREVKLAEKIVEHVPTVEEVLLCNSGSEATFHALRLARAVTKRDDVVKFQGAYNGFHDYVAMNVISEPSKLGSRDPLSAGIPQVVLDRTHVCRFNDLEDVEQTLRSHSVAAIIVEPVAHNSPGIIPKPSFLPGLRRLCDEYGSLLIFDEVITGFRHHIGGFQAICGVQPDLTTMGKAMANGFPLAALGGRRDLMERFNTNPSGDVQFGGTYNGGTVGVEAALATIATLESEPVHEHIFRLGDRMRDGLRAIAERAGIPTVVSGYGSLFILLFMDGPLESFDDAVRNDNDLFVRYRQELIARGIFEEPLSHGRSHISYSHTTEDIDRSLEAAEEALRAALDAQSRSRNR